MDNFRRKRIILEQLILMLCSFSLNKKVETWNVYFYLKEASKHTANCKQAERKNSTHIHSNLNPEILGQENNSSVISQMQLSPKPGVRYKEQQRDGPEHLPFCIMEQQQQRHAALSYLLEQAPRIFADLDEARDDVVEIDVT